MNIFADPANLERAGFLGEDESPASENDRLTVLLGQADAFCERFEIGEDIIVETYTETSDWAFFIKIDALHETACRDLMSRLLTMRQGDVALDGQMSAFIDDIEFEGRGSVLRLIELTRRPADYVRFLKCLRRMRNAFAHDMRSVNMMLAELIEPLADKAQVLKALSGEADQDYDEAKCLSLIRNDPGFLQFVILRQSMTYLSQLHADFYELGKKVVEETAAGRAPEAKSTPAFSEEPRLGLLAEGRAPGAARDGEDANAPHSPPSPAAYSPYAFTNPKRPNETRSLGWYILAFSIKGLIAVGGLAAGAAVFFAYGIWPAIAVAIVPLLPVALDGWTPGAWLGHCPRCDAEIALGATKKISLGQGCPVCSGRIRLRDKSFIAI